MNQTELRTVGLDGHRLAYRELGPASSSAILLVHGLMSDGSTWTRPAALLAEAGFRVIVPDLVGHGGSDKPADGEYHLPYFSDSLYRLLIELRASSVTV
ncbi:MAG TPA: alpha/beta fold hydrolase, partial [Jatrophihabitans sp.]|nr:alpha/beta fold hydrolase [Jatrophihabitans sp.]